MRYVLRMPVSLWYIYGTYISEYDRRCKSRSITIRPTSAVPFKIILKSITKLAQTEQGFDRKGLQIRVKCFN